MTQVPNLLQKIVGIIAMSIIVYFLLILAHFNGFNPGEYVTQISVALTIIVISIAYWTFKPDLKKFNIIVTKHDEKFEQRFRQKNDEEAKKHRQSLNDGFIQTRIRTSLHVFTLLETLQNFLDAKQFLQHIYTAHPELYKSIENLILIEQETKLKKEITEEARKKFYELKEKENQTREEFKQQFEELESKI